AIRDTGNTLVAALDKSDTVGIMDSYFPEADFFTEYERFDRHLDKLRRQGNGVDYVSICSPNYLHDSHIRFALKNNAHAICEKPLVLNPWNVDALAEIEKETGKKVYTILQLRLHPAIIALRDRVVNGPKDKIYDVKLNYVTSRGHWYHTSWKGDISKSGGIATNIGIHFFDMLIWVFGNVKNVVVSKLNEDTGAGYLELDRARVQWDLSINYDNVPEALKSKGKRTYRSLLMENEEIEFSDGFTDLHTRSYEHILAGQGFGLEAARPSIELVHKIRNHSH
ncbi:MAG: gfo/Idh/MocA family oxidoreductase, partial [Cytophagia bacterium]|nr:gfo/Idh/MocA family oxidoreductase [Cytophagia bacterium]